MTLGEALFGTPAGNPGDEVPPAQRLPFYQPGVDQSGVSVGPQITNPLAFDQEFQQYQNLSISQDQIPVPRCLGRTR